MPTQEEKITVLEENITILYPDFLQSSLIVSRVCYNAYKETARATRKVGILCQLRKRDFLH